VRYQLAVRVTSKALLSFTLLAAFAVIGHTDAKPQTHVRFMVMGDDRIRFPSEGGLRSGFDNLKSGINEGVLGPMLDSMFRMKPDFVLVTGDLVGGESKTLPGLGTLDEQLKAWITFVKHHNPNNVPVLPVRGNHETRGAHPADSWKPVQRMTKEYAMRFPGFQTDGFNLGFNYKNVTILGLDCYQSGANWASVYWSHAKVLRNKVKNVFAFSHPMFFFSGGHEDKLSNQNRDELLNALVDAGCRNFFAGHDHLYDKVTATRSDKRWHGASITQYVAGTAGAPFYAGKALPDKDAAMDGATYFLKRNPTDHVENRYAYLMVDVYGDKPPVVTPMFLDLPSIPDPKVMGVQEPAGK